MVAVVMVGWGPRIAVIRVGEREGVVGMVVRSLGEAHTIVEKADSWEVESRTMGEKLDDGREVGLMGKSSQKKQFV